MGFFASRIGSKPSESPSEARFQYLSITPIGKTTKKRIPIPPLNYMEKKIGITARILPFFLSFVLCCAVVPSFFSHLLLYLVFHSSSQANPFTL